jgi:hypothetical protein
LCRHPVQSSFDAHGRTNAVGAWMRRPDVAGNGLEQMGEERNGPGASGWF